jgi:hypothetical protein
MRMLKLNDEGYRILRKDGREAVQEHLRQFANTLGHFGLGATIAHLAEPKELPFLLDAAVNTYQVFRQADKAQCARAMFDYPLSKVPREVLLGEWQGLLQFLLGRALAQKAERDAQLTELLRQREAAHAKEWAVSKRRREAAKSHRERAAAEEDAKRNARFWLELPGHCRTYRRRVRDSARQHRRDLREIADRQRLKELVIAEALRRKQIFEQEKTERAEARTNRVAQLRAADERLGGKFGYMTSDLDAVAQDWVHLDDLDIPGLPCPVDIITEQLPATPVASMSYIYYASMHRRKKKAEEAARAAA